MPSFLLIACMLAIVLLLNSCAFLSDSAAINYMNNGDTVTCSTVGKVRLCN
jgi:endonuclease YncB( thermonuclease family)